MKRLLVTGVGGFVAQHFLDFLEDSQLKLSVLGIDVIEYRGKNIFKYLKFQYQKLDLLKQEEIDNILLLFRPDCILHLASYSSVAFSWKNPVLSFQNNTTIFLNLIEVIRKYSLKIRILSIGSSEEYGNINAKDLPLKETSKLDPLSPYAVARVSQEMISKLYADSYGLDVVMTRSFNHVGPGQNEVFVVSSFVKRVLELSRGNQKKVTLMTGDTTIIRDFLDVRDVVRSYYFLLEKGISGEIYNVCSGIPVSLKEIINLIAEVLNVDIVTITDNNLIRPNDNMIIVGSNLKLRESTGWCPEYSLKDSIRDIIEYWDQKI